MIKFIVPAIEISLIALVISYLFSFFWNTRTMDLIFGFFAFLLIFSASRWLHLNVIERLMDYFVSVLPLATLIIFQPELRIALSKLSFISKNTQEITEFDRFLEEIASSIYRLAAKNVGAIVVLQNQDPLDEYANKSIILNANFSPELLESIFMTTTPLHDGAVIVKGTILVSAATILPLADDTSQLTKSMGTRHRASLGMSQVTDALIIVISEETGKVSIAREGMMTRGVKIDRFKGILRSIFNPMPSTSSYYRLSLHRWTNKLIQLLKS